jgi:hypothetical protein
MFANTLFRWCETILAIIVLPVQIVTTLVLGVAVSISFGLLLIPISAIWIVVLWAPLIGLSWIGSKVPLLRELVGIVGLPIALTANTYVCIMPSMGEFESRAAKLTFTRTWPYSWEFFQLQRGALDLASPQGTELSQVIERAIPKNDALSWRTLQRIIDREPLDTTYSGIFDANGCEVDTGPALSPSISASRDPSIPAPSAATSAASISSVLHWLSRRPCTT